MTGVGGAKGWECSGDECALDLGLALGGRGLVDVKLDVEMIMKDLTPLGTRRLAHIPQRDSRANSIDQIKNDISSVPATIRKCTRIEQASLSKQRWKQEFLWVILAW